jgi:hypothetical protein
MSVITEAAPVPNRVEVVARYLRTRRDGETRKRLAALLSPPSLQRASDDPGEEGPSNALADALLRACQRLGVTVADGERVCLAPHLQSSDKSNAEALRCYLEDTLLSVNAPDDQRDVARTLAWFLAQNPAQPLQVGNVKQRIEEQLVESEDAQLNHLTNATRFEQFTYWARYLGCAWRFKVRTDLVVPDPTQLLARYLPRLLKIGEQVTLRVLLERWRTPLPILETGEIRTSLERTLRAEFQRPAEQLSPATSLALLRLQDRGQLRMERLADAPALLLASWPDRRPISHVTWLGDVQ